MERVVRSIPKKFIVLYVGSWSLIIQGFLQWEFAMDCDWIRCELMLEKKNQLLYNSLSASIVIASALIKLCVKWNSWSKQRNIAGLCTSWMNWNRPTIFPFIDSDSDIKRKTFHIAYLKNKIWNFIQLEWHLFSAWMIILGILYRSLFHI